ncbi:MAG: hypothetical protein PHX18_05300 [Candidatus Gastranaerophilales bacterium]|nr:hypothetical protein [Candidatus Gastranaerophilales bacterium]
MDRSDQIQNQINDEIARYKSKIAMLRRQLSQAKDAEKKEHENKRNREKLEREREENRFQNQLTYKLKTNETMSNKDLIERLIQLTK